MKNFKTLAIVSVLMAVSAPLKASDYPSKPVRIVVGFPPGQTTDIIARKLAQRLTSTLGQSFYVENRPGVGAGLAAELVARAEPDGYTLLATSSGPMAVNRWVHTNLKYDVKRDFKPIALIGTFPLVLVTSTNSRFSTMKDLLTYAKGHPGKINYGSGGNGVTNHLVMEMFKERAGVDLTHVPYKGGVAAMTDVVAGQVDVMFEVVSIAEPLIRQGKLNALAVASDKRVSTLPEVPTVGELGYPNFRGEPWIGLVAPKGLPPPVLAKLTAAIDRAAKSPEWKQEITLLGATPRPMGHAEFGDFIQSEMARWGDVAKRVNVKAD
ncbi:Bug family tripartite tricarboxylate transporter substrate binding protein [Cupriavidus oxalaticus]|uniref:Tripartite tricarboxylate transporter substrate binding protein n=1 Tax=Cupriavidus oxalaticus TaxID=96344 RepID=A0A4P7LJC1_9BURK|nr:tripartite tricarboxylate transporter substrate binding protein [Cupriavidus oxalaticus]QBY56260.1 tripartite tricarboxylate transporter substrate binding protein [Cupriavidus oxalaticus]